MLLPPNMLDWVPEGHAVRVVIGTVESVVNLYKKKKKKKKIFTAGPARYDPVMPLTVWMYAYLRGVLSTRGGWRTAAATTRRSGVACGRQVPGHTTLSRFRKQPARAGRARGGAVL